jgi:hypothetical protein
MKHFLIRFLYFCLPVLVIIIAFELVIRNGKNTFTLKAKHFNELSTVDVVVLGSSHNQSAINPHYLQWSSANLAYGSQDLFLDLQLLKKTLEQNKKPKVVVAEFAYHTLFRANRSNYWRNGLYEYFYHLQLPNTNFLSRNILISSNLKFFKQYLLQEFLRKNKNKELNRWGYDETDMAGLYQDLNYDTTKIGYLSSQRLKERVPQDVEKKILDKNIACLSDIVELCKTNDVRLILLTPPVYKTYRRLYSQENVRTRDSVMTGIQKKLPNVVWLNFENSNLFTVADFKNDDHLNSQGANKLSLLLNDSIKEHHRQFIVEP